MKKSYLKRPGTYIFAGAAITVFGLVYAVLFAGIPYQDPTPAQQADWLFHDAMSMNVMQFGMAIFVIAYLWKLAAWVARLRKCSRPRAPINGPFQ